MILHTIETGAAVAVLTAFVVYHFFGKYLPIPGGIGTSTSPAVKAADATASVICAYNNGHSEFNLAPVWNEPANGVVIHKITMAQANVISAAAQSACKQYDYPITFLLACLGVESLLDPLCQNANLGPGESNATSRALGGYDMGIAQFKLEMLAAALSITVEQAQAFALDPTKAIPQHVRDMAALVEWAKTIIATPVAPGVTAPDPRFGNPYLVATCAYNYGKTGLLSDYYYKGIFPDGQDGRKSHGAAVISDESYFAGKLGVASIFAGLVSA